jgi:uncharacterized repeat protein (TIGR01451 family)
MKTTNLHQLAIAVILGLGMTLVLTLVMMLGGGTSVVFAEDQPDGSTIISPQTIDGTWGPGTITADTDVVIQSGVVITIAPNTTIRVADGVGFTVSGDLHSDGPVAFTGISATPGAWEGITYANGSTGYLNQATIEYAQHALTLDTSNPITISNSILRNNRHAPGSGQNAVGAGLYIRRGNHLISTSHIHGNTAQASGSRQVRGAGIHIENGSPRILDSWIYENTAIASSREVYGGGIGIAAGEALIENSHILTNTIQGGSGNRLRSGGGIGIIGNTSAVIRNSRIEANRNAPAAGYAAGGGIGFNSNARVSLIEGNVISANYISGQGWAEGGGIDFWSGNVATINNNLIIGNTTGLGGSWSPIGGGLNVNAANPGVFIINNTIVGNEAVDSSSGDGRGGGLYLQGGNNTNLIVRNNIIGSNRAGYRGGGVYRSRGTVDYNDIFGNTAPSGANWYGSVGSNNITVDPIFLGTGDLVQQHHLPHNSPVIDAGTSSSASLPNRDYDGQYRPLGTTWDMGFDEVEPFTYAKSVDQDTISSGLPLVYRIVITNSDPYATLLGAGVTDALPANTTYSSGPTCNLGSCAYDAGTNTVTWTGDVPGDSLLTLDYTVLVDIGLTDGTQITNQADITVDDVTETTNAVITVVYNPDLTVAKSADPEPVEAGEVLSYTIIIANNGLGDATGVTVSDALPANTQFVPGSIVLDPPGAGTAGTAPPSLATGVRIDAGQSVTVTFEVTVDKPLDAGAIIENDASATSIQDPTPTTASADSTVTTTPAVQVDKSGPNSAHAYDTVLFTFEVTNVGNTLLHNVDVEDDYAGTGSYVSGDDGDGWLDLTEAWVYTASYTIQPDDPDPLINTVTVTATDVWGTETTAFDTHGVSPGPSTGAVFLPIVIRAGTAGLPDLVVEDLTATSDSVALTIRNQGDGEVTDAFWIDVYFNPSETPGLNQPWDTIADYGVVWGVTTDIPAGDSLTLTTGDEYYSPEHSSPAPWPVEANVFALVDSINYETTYGAVLESNEDNNLFGPVTSTADVTGGTVQSGGQSQPAAREGLPTR